MALTSESMKAVPLTIEFPADGNGGIITIKNSPKSGMWYSVNSRDKTLIELTNYDIPVKAGDEISLYANGTGNKHYHPHDPHPYLNIRCSSDCYLYGNVMSLISRDEFETLTKAPICAFYGLFEGNVNIHNHSLKGIVLPATTLVDNCYESMFRGCISLTQAPELPATTLDWNCYQSMFQGCTGLTQAPKLPATTLVDNCYESMFRGCISLTQAPELPATTLADNCYQSMFQGCISLTQAPELPATTLAESCYESMFEGCTSLASITCLASEPSYYYYTFKWVKDVSKTGTFIKEKDVDWETGVNGIPRGWEVIEVE